MAEPSLGSGRCANCGQGIPDQSKFCPFCGHNSPFQKDPESKGGIVERIERLVALHASGALDDDEFRKAKAKLLAE